MLSNHKRLLLGLSLVLCIAGFHSSLAQEHDFWNDDIKTIAVPGRRPFNTNCAPCHGLDGRGSDKGADIAGGAKLRHLSDSQVSAIISNGIPGTGMPAFHHLGEQQLRAVVSYLRILEGKLEARKLPGDRARGRNIFFGKGECSSCHTISGEGGFLGPDLSGYGSTMSANAIRDEIVRADRIDTAGYRSAVLTTRDGDRLEGVIRNEDNFSVQLQTNDGRFHFLQKSDLTTAEYPGHSLMPADYRKRLGPSELNDLVSYLMNNAPTPSQAPASHKMENPAK